MTTTADRAPLPGTPETTARPAWFPAAAAVFAAGWGGNQFTPLLVMYHAAGYSAFTVDALLGAYVVGLVPGLLLSGGLSNRYGRRPVMFAGTVLSLLASALLALGPLGVAWIAGGRFLSGIAVAVAMAVGSTWIKELADADPYTTADTGTRRAALCLTLGLGIGPGVAGVLAQWGPWPMVLPYLVHIGLALVSLAAVTRSPETLTVRTDSVRAALPATARHPRFRRVILPAAPWIFGACGVAYAILPQLVQHQTGSWALAFSTLLTVCAIGAGVGIQPIAKRVDRATSARAVLTGMTVLCVGLILSVFAAAQESPWIALGAAVVLGTAYGIVVVSGLLELQRLARPGEIAELTGVYYALAYIGFLLPSLLAALNGVAGYPVLLACVALVAIAGTLVVSRHSRRHLPQD